MSEATCHIPLHDLEHYVMEIFQAIGVPADDARICADVLVSADRRGIDSHGIGRLKPIYYDRIVKHKTVRPVTHIEQVRDVAATAVLDGHHGMGMVVGHRAMSSAIEKARVHGLGAVAVRNSTHYGFAAYYPLMAVREGMIGMTTTNARPSMPPVFGVENMLGTNPLVFAMPTDEPFAFTNDYATTIIQRGRIEQFVREGRSCPPGLVIDRAGRSKTDPAEVLEDLLHNRAALAPLGGPQEESGGHKGYGFALVAELLSAALQQGAWLRHLSGLDEHGMHRPHSLGHFFMAMRVDAFTDLEAFKKTAGDILRTLRASSLAPGAERIYTHGEKEWLASIEREHSGVPVGRQLQQELIDMRDEQGLTIRFPFDRPAREAAAGNDGQPPRTAPE